LTNFLKFSSGKNRFLYSSKLSKKRITKLHLAIKSFILDKLVFHFLRLALSPFNFLTSNAAALAATYSFYHALETHSKNPGCSGQKFSKRNRLTLGMEV
jgi:hypothetical protein